MSKETATHRLACRHVLGCNDREYHMPCDVLKTMPDGRLKVRVYGRLFWREGSSRIRYVSAWRVTPKGGE
jgi:hypothetical protein